MTLLPRLVCETSKVRLVPRATNHQKVLIKAVEKGVREVITGVERTRKARKTKKNIITSNILLISYHLCLYNSVNTILITSPITNQIVIISQTTSQIAKIG